MDELVKNLMEELNCDTAFTIPKVKEAFERGEQLVVDLDGTYGLGPSFLEEAFGGLIRKGFDYGQLMSVFKFKSIEVPYYIDDIKKYLKEANENK